jgi:hypothetical protein
MEQYCQTDQLGIAHVVPGIQVGRRCACGRKIFVMLDDTGPVLRDAPSRERLAAMVMLLAAARKAPARRTAWEARLLC